MPSISNPDADVQTNSFDNRHKTLAIVFNLTFLFVFMVVINYLHIFAQPCDSCYLSVCPRSCRSQSSIYSFVAVSVSMIVSSSISLSTDRWWRQSDGLSRYFRNGHVIVSTRAAALVLLEDVDELLQFEVLQSELILTF